MAGSAQQVMRHSSRFSRLWWLPGNGHGNGLDDTAWAAILDVRDALVANEVLDGLRSAGVPAYAAALPRRQARHRRSGERGLAANEPPMRIWVGASAHATAEERLIGLAPVLVGRFGATALR
jgi:hypothetical protein